ncbi:DUF2007 domain-containing protein [Mesobacterium pallidum]|uniref:putative signal transducing protein n=1 Tax=Mesobacterium pallidum TaxID=2872037 RepID=UPI001EE2151E|nr:DUF2007 domain-containing protein [Mesobacterium pallidum]
MKELLRSNDIALMAYVRALLEGEDIALFELDVNMSVLEGSIGILPRRAMVADSDYDRARALLEEHEIAPS